MTMSHRSEMTSSQLVVAMRKPNFSLIFLRSSGFRRFTIVKSTCSRHRSRFGRWELTVHEPAPITPRRSLAIAEGKLSGANGECQKGGATGRRRAAYDAPVLEPPPNGRGGCDVEGRQARTDSG